MVTGRAIGGETRLMGIIGDPIAQARTPQAINPIFARHGADIVCVPFHVPAAGLAAAWAGLQAMPNVVGFGVTIPHKQDVLGLCGSLDPLAERVGAVNFVRREADGSFRGYQFDGAGFVRGMTEHGIELGGRRALMLGAGGASIAIAFALHDAGVSRLIVANRTRSKAEALAASVNAAGRGNFAGAGDARPEPGDLVINATSLGLNGNDALPIDPEALDGSMTVAEVVAKPERTRLLEEAAARGARTHSGIHMIDGQVGLIADRVMELWR